MAGGYNLATYAVSPISQGSAHWAGGLFYGSFILELLDELFVAQIGTQSSTCPVFFKRDWVCMSE